MPNQQLIEYIGQVQRVNYDYSIVMILLGFILFATLLASVIVSILDFLTRGFLWNRLKKYHKAELLLINQDFENFFSFLWFGGPMFGYLYKNLTLRRWIGCFWCGSIHKKLKSSYNSACDFIYSPETFQDQEIQKFKNEVVAYQKWRRILVVSFLVLFIFVFLIMIIILKRS